MANILTQPALHTLISMCHLGIKEALIIRLQIQTIVLTRHHTCSAARTFIMNLKYPQLRFRNLMSFFLNVYNKAMLPKANIMNDTITPMAAP